MSLETLKLLDGSKIPSIGFGPGILSWYAKYNKPLHHKLPELSRRIINKYYRYPRDRKNFVDAILNALELGYRVIDYAQAYGNPELIGKALSITDVPREEIYLTTRISNAAQYKGTQREELLRCLDKYGTDYIDIVQFHFPVTGHYLKTWEEILRLQQEGYLRYPSVANCNIHHLNEIINYTGSTPFINQIEVHPLFTQKPLVQFCKSKNILVEAYTPVARYDERLVRWPSLRKLASKYNKSIGQIILRWHIQNGIMPVVRCLSYAHQADNINIFNFNISDEDMALIDSYNINSRLRFDPDNCDFTVL